MSREIEIEFKNLLKQDEFLLLLKEFHLKESNFIVQHNDYFDTPSFELKEKGSALRIREKKDQCVLTLKQPAKVGLMETHQRLEKRQAEAIIHGENIPDGEVTRALIQMNVDTDQLRHLGRLTTMRAEISYRGGTLVFDHSFFGDKEDFELEYEVNNPEEGQRAFFEMLHQFNIPQRKTENKIQRLMNAITKQ
ncbi:MAG: CYTH domain-containing protein [Tuberibacillus sp.]